MGTHEGLDVWAKSLELVEKIYDATKSFPESEKYILESQIKRAVISIPSNIAEGAAKQSDKEYIRYLYIALGSVTEVDTQYKIAMKLKFVQIDYSTIDLISQVKGMIINLIRYLKTLNR